MNSKEEWINVSLFDIDGCLHAGNCKTIDEVEEKNKTLFQTIAQRVKNEKFTKVIVGFATNRQDNEMDVINGGFLSLTCTKTLPHVQQQLANLLAKSKIPVLFDPGSARPDNGYRYDNHRNSETSDDYARGRQVLSCPHRTSRAASLPSCPSS